MEYNAKKKAFHCHLCGSSPWKSIYTGVIVDYESGLFYCLEHSYHEIGHWDLVPEWRDHDNADI